MLHMLMGASGRIALRKTALQKSLAQISPFSLQQRTFSILARPAIQRQALLTPRLPQTMLLTPF